MNSRLPRFTALLILLTAAALAATWHRGGAADARSDPAKLAEGVGDQLSGVEDETTDTRHPTPDTGFAPKRGQDPSIGDRLVVQAAAQLERRGSVAARLRHQVALAGTQFYGVGSYWQQGSGDELRVRLELQVAGQDAALLQVSNSRFLWTDRRLPTGRAVTRIDLKQLRAEPLPRTSFSPEPAATAELDAIPPASASWTSVQPELTAHCGGLPGLLATLGQNFSFLPPQAMRLAIAPPAASQPASIPVFAVVGHWKPERLAALLAKERPFSPEPTATGTTTAVAVGSGLNASLLESAPARIPQEVLLLVGQADLFPYRIEYRRLETPTSASPDARPAAAYQLSANPTVVLELSDVAFVPIAAGQFDYFPVDVHWTDQTATVLERLGRERQQQVATRPGNHQAILPMQ